MITTQTWRCKEKRRSHLSLDVSKNEFNPRGETRGSGNERVRVAHTAADSSLLHAIDPLPPSPDANSTHRRRRADVHDLLLFVGSKRRLSVCASRTYSHQRSTSNRLCNNNKHKHTCIVSLIRQRCLSICERACTRAALRLSRTPLDNTLAHESSAHERHSHASVLTRPYADVGDGCCCCCDGAGIAAATCIALSLTDAVDDLSPRRRRMMNTSYGDTSEQQHDAARNATSNGSDREW